MVPTYINSRYYESFKHLMYLAAWAPDILSKPLHRQIFFAYAFLVQFAFLVFISLQIVDLYFVLGNLQKMAFNFCSSTVTIGILGKMILLYRRRETLTSLHYNLWKDSVKYNGEEEVAIQDEAYRRFNYVRKILFAGPFTVIPIWGLASYFSYKWGPRLLPFAGYLPIEDLNNDAVYLPVLIYELILGYYVAQTVLETDVMMLGIVLQIGAHYQILCKNLIKLNQVFEGNECGGNKFLKNERVLGKLRGIVKRHLELLQYCEDVEYIFNGCMVIQLLGGSFVLLMNGIETTRRINEMSVPLCYQIMYVTFGMIDIYVICHYFTALTTENVNVGLAVYSCGWHNMDAKVRRMLCFIMSRAQNPPKFTYGKLFTIDVNAYMHSGREVYKI